MSNKVESYKIKKHTYYFLDYIINIKIFYLNKIKIQSKRFGNKKIILFLQEIFQSGVFSFNNMKKK